MDLRYTDREYEEKIVKEKALTPLVFEDGKLIGWGRKFAKQKKSHLF